MAKASSEEKVLYQFLTNLRVLAIDNDPTVLEFIKNTCNQCQYYVMICSESPLALNIVRERKDCVDVILMEVHMPNMDGYEFLHHVSKEIDVPVIMMSLDRDKNSVLKAVKLGACDYWIKPLHEYQLKNIWTHVVRKALNENKIQKDIGSLEDDDERRRKRGNDNSEFASSSSAVRDQRNSSSREADDDVDLSEHCSPSKKKSRVIWLPELHHTFVKAVNKLGLDRAVPKKILEEMNVTGLTRENVASHLQKYRHFLKTKSDGATQTHEHNEIPETIESRVAASERFHLQQPLAATSHVTYQTLVGSHPAHFHAEQALAYVHPLAKCSSNMAIAKNFPQSIWTLADPSRYGAWLPSSAVVIEKQAIQGNNVLVGTLQQQRQQQSLMHQQIPPINSMIISENPASAYSNSFSVVQIDGGNTRSGAIFNRYAATASISQQFQNSNSGLTSGAMRSFPAPVSPYGSRAGVSLYQESPNSSASGFSNQNFSSDIDDNTTN